MPIESDIPTSSPQYQPEANRVDIPGGSTSPPPEGSAIARLSPGSPLHELGGVRNGAGVPEGEQRKDDVHEQCCDARDQSGSEEKFRLQSLRR